MTLTKLTNNFYDKNEIRQRLILYVKLSSRKKKELKNKLKRQEEAKDNELLNWYAWWDEYHN